MCFYDEYQETLPREEIQEIQLQKLKKQVRHIYKHNRFMRQRFDSQEVNPDIKKLEEIKNIPFTFKEDLRANYPFGLLCVDREEVCRVHMTSGTTGVPTPMFYTKNDLQIWADCMARVFVSGGIKKGDIVQQAHGYGLFTGGFGFHYGLELAGAIVIPTGSGGTERQLRLMQEWGTTVFTGTPSYAAYLTEIALEKGIDPVQDLNLRIGFHGGEPCSEELRKRINERIGYQARGGGLRVVYGLTEVGGPVSGECAETAGIHLWQDHFLVEVLDPETLQDVENGKPGELVLTNLSFEAMPILRFRTGDRVIVDFATCSCGRTHPRITHFLGRVDDMLLVSGTNVFPGQVEFVLLQHPEFSENWQLVVSDKKGLHSLRVEVEPVAGVQVSKDFIKQLEKELHGYLEISCTVDLKPVGSLPRFEGKAVRVRDERQ